MTDNEIIKALEYCRDYDCVNCTVEDCKDPLCFALSLINRQKAEIESLTNKYNLAVSEREANMCGFLEELNRYETERKEIRAEIEEKTKKLQEILPIVAELKAEAVKAVIKRMRDISQPYLAEYWVVSETQLKSLEKEMVGEG